MEFVYFDEELAERAPALMGSLLIKDTDRWASLHDVAEALRRGEQVTIRQPTQFEREFAEETVALCEIWQELAMRRQQLFRHVAAYAETIDPAVAADRLNSMQEGA